MPSPDLPFNVITWITTHLPTPEGWKAELAYTYINRCFSFITNYRKMMFLSIGEHTRVAHEITFQ